MLRHQTRKLTAFVLWACAGAACHGSSPALAQFSPYERNPMIFNSPAQAVAALDSPDIMMRRSGVEWLGRWTATDGASIDPRVDYTNQSSLRGRSDLVPALARAVREMPTQDVLQAAALLALIGPKARPAIPAMCDAMDHLSIADTNTVAGDIGQVCGGQDKIASIVAAFLSDKAPANRLSAARGLRDCMNPTYQPPGSVMKMVTWDERKTWPIHFQQQAVPALDRALRDPDSAVRIAAAESLDALTSQFDEAYAPKVWQPTVPNAMKLASSTDPSERLAGLKMFTTLPCDISQATPVLRAALAGDAEERKYALLALCWASRWNPLNTVEIFLSERPRSGSADQEAYSADLAYSAVALWSGMPGRYGEFDWADDPSLRQFMVIDPSLNRGSAQDNVRRHDVLLAGILDIARSPNPIVRRNVATALERIAAYEEQLLGTYPVVAGKGYIGEDPFEKILATASKIDTLWEVTDPALSNEFRQKVRMPTSIS